MQFFYDFPKSSISSTCVFCARSSPTLTLCCGHASHTTCFIQARSVCGCGHLAHHVHPFSSTVDPFDLHSELYAIRDQFSTEECSKCTHNENQLFLPSPQADTDKDIAEDWVDALDELDEAELKAKLKARKEEAEAEAEPELDSWVEVEKPRTEVSAGLA
eukprot:TRINITY_DN2325_c0_g1_i7.p1 TRINITY_DN2325_c0_g1~~TRINITY_DN2325_c0_g1_i7.p1  ORF type:complete len:160 (+),score=13.42 TRINITY_DN2325_c0_g1_i7:110-589(+)